MFLFANLTGMKPFLSNEMVVTLKGFQKPRRGLLSVTSCGRVSTLQLVQDPAAWWKFQLVNNTDGLSDGTTITRSKGIIEPSGFNCCCSTLL